MFTYRMATVADIPCLAAIRMEVTENALTDPGRVTRAMYHEYISERGCGWVCESRNIIVGFAVASLVDRSIWALFVHPEYEGRGIGSKLLQLAVDWLFEQGVDMITLSTDPNTRAEELYKARGWERGEHIANGEILYRLGRA